MKKMYLFLVCLVLFISGPFVILAVESSPEPSTSYLPPDLPVSDESGMTMGNVVEAIDSVCGKIDEMNNSIDSSLNQMQENFDKIDNAVTEQDVYTSSITSSDRPDWVGDIVSDGKGQTYLYCKYEYNGKVNVFRMSVDPTALNEEIVITGTYDWQHSEYLRIRVLGIEKLKGEIDVVQYAPQRAKGQDNNTYDFTLISCCKKLNVKFWTDSPTVASKVNKMEINGGEVLYTENPDVFKYEKEQGIIPEDVDKSYKVSSLNVRVVNFQELVDLMKNAGLGGGISSLPSVGEAEGNTIDLGNIDYLAPTSKEDSWLVKLFKNVAHFLKSLIVPDDVKKSDGTTINYFEFEFNDMHQEFTNKVPAVGQVGNLIEDLKTNFENEDTDQVPVVPAQTIKLNLMGQDQEIKFNFIDLSIMDDQLRMKLRSVILLIAYVKFIISLPKKMQKVVKG